MPTMMSPLSDPSPSLISRLGDPFRTWHRASLFITDRDCSSWFCPYSRQGGQSLLGRALISREMLLAPRLSWEPFSILCCPLVG